MTQLLNVLEEAVELPECELRVPSPRAGDFFCRHALVRGAGNLVTAEICQVCLMREVPCAAPRPPESLERRGPLPGLIRRGWDLTRSLAAFVADGFRSVTQEQYQQRLEICDGCDRRRGNWCRQCGCQLSLKARGRAFQCPLGKWPV